MIAFPAIRLALLLAAAAMAPATPLVRDDVDMIELNHVYDGEGRLVLRQLIFWNWQPSDARFHVVAWRLWQPGQPAPMRDWQRGGYVLLWHDGQVLRWVQSRVYRETWTQHDPEIADRQRLSQDKRAGLSASEPPPSMNILPPRHR